MRCGQVLAAEGPAEVCGGKGKGEDRGEVKERRRHAFVLFDFFFYDVNDGWL